MILTGKSLYCRLIYTTCKCFIQLTWQIFYWYLIMYFSEWSHLSHTAMVIIQEKNYTLLLSIVGHRITQQSYKFMLISIFCIVFLYYSCGWTKSTIFCNLLGEYLELFYNLLVEYLDLFLQSFRRIIGSFLQSLRRIFGSCGYFEQKMF